MVAERCQLMIAAAWEYPTTVEAVRIREDTVELGKGPAAQPSKSNPSLYRKSP
jgi:hypothetical protein